MNCDLGTHALIYNSYPIKHNKHTVKFYRAQFDIVFSGHPCSS